MSNSVKVRFTEEPQFYVNEDNKTVTCKIKAYLDNPAVENIAESDGIIIFNDELCAAATAKCSPNDAFDIDRGKRIAMAKAENKIYQKAYSRLRHWMATFEDIMYRLDKSCNNFMVYFDHNQDYIEEISDSNCQINPVKRGITKIVAKKK